MTTMARLLPVGTPVTVHPGGGHRACDTWDAVITAHRRWPDGSPQGLTDVTVTDTGGFANLRVGLVVTVETVKLAARVAAEQTALDLNADDNPERN